MGAKFRVRSNPLVRLLGRAASLRGGHLADDAVCRGGVPTRRTATPARAASTRVSESWPLSD
jgi:hypothetical protein